jgi:hypothetical protein
MKTNHSSPIRREIEQIGREMLASIYEALLGDGQIDPDGKSEEQIMSEVREMALQWSKQRPMLWSTDFRQNLLNRARSFKRKGNNHEAILYYGTWFEHWINGVLLRRLHKLDEREGCQMIRDVGLRGKFTWLLSLIHEKRIPQRHIKAVLQVCDLRNEFVHHKYKMFDVDTGDDEGKKLKEAHRSAEKSVRYLQKFEERHFFKGSARGLLKKLRNTKHEKAT